MGDHSFGLGVEADGQGPAEANSGQRDIGCGVLVVDCSVADRSCDEAVEDVLCGFLLFGPVVVFEERVHDVDGAETALDGSMQVAA